MRRWGIRARVLFLALVPSSLILAMLVAYFTTARISDADTQLAQRGAALARQLAPGAEFALFAADRAALQRMADAAAKEADVANVTIADANGRVVAHSGSARTDPDAVRFTEAVMASRLAAGDLPEQMSSSAPRKVGDISVEMSRSGSDAHRRALVLVGLALGMLGIFLAVVLSVFIGASVTRPVRRLAEAMRVLSEHGSVTRLADEDGGELRTLTRGFNEMASRLQANARDLEVRIERATRALTAQKNAAEQATDAKSRFIAAASHDLRQPLHAIGLFSGTLQRRTRGSDLEPVVRDLARAVAAMDKLFEGLLDLSRLDAGTVVARPRPFPLDRLFSQLQVEFADAATRKGLRLRLRAAHVLVSSDELLLHRLLSNLIANAIRYTERGAVLVGARRRGEEVRLEVRDSGIGIPVDQQNEIFQEFYQVANAERDRSVGLGLGLAIVAKLAGLLGTRVHVRSKPSRGSVFFLDVPVAPRGAEPIVEEEAADPDGEPAIPIHVVVVDDDPLVLAGNESLLGELGCTVTAVRDADAAEAALASMRTDRVLLLCDLWLPGDEDGIAIVRRLGSLATPAVSGILISGDTRPETIRAAKDAGLLLLHKPVSPSKLRAIVDHFATGPKAPRGEST
jgi:signal transduction histidine kinase